MKIQIENNPNYDDVIESASVFKNQHSLSIFIDTKMRWVEPDTVIYGCGQIEYWFDNSEEDISKVIISSETDEEFEILKRLSFEMHDKYQLWYMFPKDEVVNYK